MRNKFFLPFLIISFTAILYPQTIDVLIKGVDDGVKTNKQQDFQEAEMNAKLQAIERAGIEVTSITKVVNFQIKYDMIETKAQAILLPGFQIMDLGYQPDGTYQVVLSGGVRTGGEHVNTDNMAIIINRLLDLLPDNSKEATKNISLTLELLPSNYDYLSNSLINRARTRVLTEKVRKGRLTLTGLPTDLDEDGRESTRKARVEYLIPKFQSAIDRFPRRPKQPVELIIGKGKASGDVTIENLNRWRIWITIYPQNIPGTYVLTKDSSRIALDNRYMDHKNKRHTKAYERGTKDKWLSSEDRKWYAIREYNWQFENMKETYIPDLDAYEGRKEEISRLWNGIVAIMNELQQISAPIPQNSINKWSDILLEIEKLGL